MGLVGVVLLLSLGGAPWFAPTDDADVVEQRHVRVLLIGGLGTPVGELGAEIGFVPWSHLELAVGAGLGLSGRQVAASVRLRLRPDSILVLTVGGGVSRGDYSDSHCIPIGGACPGRWDGTINWANVEVGLGNQPTGPLAWRAILGVGIPLNPGGLTCSDRVDPCGEPRDHRAGAVPFVGFAVGWAGA